MFRTSSQLLHGPSGRSQSVLAVLLRIRQKYQRTPQTSHRRDMPLELVSPFRDFATSPLQERQHLLNEAMQILRKEVRGSETLSDVDATSTLFCVEVGKLLSAGAAFGAATTTPRIAEALQWVRVNKKHLTSTRQVMSICTPLLNLKDGKTAGRSFVLEELYMPLLATLENPIAATVLIESELKQQRSAVVSVFNLIGRMLGGDGDDTDEGRKDMTDDKKKDGSQTKDDSLREMGALLFVKGVDILFSFAEYSLPPLEIVECCYILQSCQRLEKDLEGNLLRKVQTGLTRIRPMIDAALGHCAAGTTKRASDICHLLTVASKLHQTHHMVEISRAALAFLPPALASATAKDICIALQLLLRLCGNAPEVTEAMLIQQVVEAVRPKLFLIAETQPSSLRHIECSILMSTLSRLEVDVADDLVNLLCGCFSASVGMAEPAQLVPFLLGLFRYSETVSRSSTGSHTIPFVERSRLPSVLPCLEKVADRVIALASSGILTCYESAQLLLAFSQLQYRRVVAVYMSMEEKLAEAVNRLLKGEYNDNNETIGDCNEGQMFSQEASAGAIALTSVLMNALNVFRNEAVILAEEEEVYLQRAGNMFESLRHGAVEGITRIQQSKSLVMLLHLFTFDDKKRDDSPRVEDGGGKTVDVIVEDDVSIGSVVSSTSSSSFRLLDTAAQQVCLLAPVSNAYEVGALAKSIGDLMSRKFIGEAEAQIAIEALLQRSEVVELSFYDTYSLLEGMRRVGVSSIPSSLFYRIAVLLKTTPKRTMPMLRRLLSILRMTAPKPIAVEALMKLTAVAMENTFSMALMNTSSSPPLRDTVLLAHMLAQLYDITFELLVVGTVGVEQIGLAEEQVEETKTVLCDAVPEETSEMQNKLMDVTTKAFMVLGDIACAFLRQHSGVGEDASNSPIFPQEVVMLVQSFEKVGVRHHALLYEVVPLVRDMSGAMEPLELSLLLNAFARLGAWNGRILNSLACNVATRVQTCSLKQCQSILQALQSSQFLHPNAFLLTPEYKASVEQDWHLASFRQAHAVIDPLVALATSVVERMNALIEEADSATAVLESYTLEDIVAVVRVLGFFDQPPQPAFDTYYGIGMKKMLFTRKNTVNINLPREYRKWLMSVISLAGYVGKVRQYDRRCASARAIVSLVTNQETSASSLMTAMHLMPEEKVAEFYYLRCVFAMLYGVVFLPEDASSFLQVMLEKFRSEDVARNPRRVSSAVRYLTKITCKGIGAPHLVYDIVFDSVVRLFERMHVNAGDKADGSNDVLRMCSSTAAAVILEGLCAGQLVTFPCGVGKKREMQLLSSFANHLVKAGGLQLSAAEACSALLAVAITTVSHTATAHLEMSSMTWLDAVQHDILVKEQQLSVHDAVNVIIAGALCGKKGVVRAETVQCASRVLVSQMGKTDQTGLWLLSEIYRLVTAGDACFLKWCTQQQAVSGDTTVRAVMAVFDRVLPTLLRAVRAAGRNTAPTLSLQCRIDVVERYRQCVALSGDDAVLTAALEELVA